MADHIQQDVPVDSRDRDAERVVCPHCCGESVKMKIGCAVCNGTGWIAAPPAPAVERVGDKPVCGDLPDWEHLATSLRRDLIRAHEKCAALRAEVEAIEKLRSAAYAEVERLENCRPLALALHAEEENQQLRASNAALLVLAHELSAYFADDMPRHLQERLDELAAHAANEPGGA